MIYVFGDLEYVFLICVFNMDSWYEDVLDLNGDWWSLWIEENGWIEYELKLIENVANVVRSYAILESC